MKLKLKMFNDFSNNKKMFNKYSNKSRNYYDTNTLDVHKMKDDMGGIVILRNFEENMYLILVIDSSKYEERKGLNKNVAAKISHSEYKNVLLNKKIKGIHLIEFKAKIIE